MVNWLRFDHPRGYYLVDDAGWVITQELSVPPSGDKTGLVFKPVPDAYIFLNEEWVDRAEGALWRKHWAHKDHVWFHPTYSDD